MENILASSMYKAGVAIHAI